MERINIIVTEEFKKQVKLKCIDNNETITDYVIRLVKGDMERDKRRED